MGKKKVKGTKPTVAQRKILQKEVGDRWTEYLYETTKFVDPDDNKRRLSKEKEKVKVVSFRNKINGGRLVIRYYESEQLVD